MGKYFIKMLEVVSKEFPGKIAVGIDAKNGYVATDGWAKTTSVKSFELAKQLEDVGVSCIIYTDIDKDGAMNGPNIEQTITLANQISTPVIASGGISALEDLIQFRKSNVELNGVIAGRAIYDEVFSINDAIKVLRS